MPIGPRGERLPYGDEDKEDYRGSKFSGPKNKPKPRAIPKKRMPRETDSYYRMNALMRRMDG